VTSDAASRPEHHDLDGDGDGPRLWVIRHGPTEWSSTGRHTGRTDVPLTVEGEREAATLRDRLGGVDVGLVLTSPLQRARRTAELAGFPHAELEPLAREWDYGDYEGRTRAEIRREVPDWSPWTHPDMPNGERLDQVAARAGELVERVRSSGVDNAILFAHGHLLRMVAVTWIEAPWPMAWRLPVDPATISILGWDRGTTVLERWNS
jgi:broad specificity phosphatase PhoE